MECDLLLHNGHCFTFDSAYPQVDALAIQEGRIIWVGKEWQGKAKRILDLKGAFVYPGLIDAHMHVLFAGLVKSYLQLQGCRSCDEVLQKISEKASQTEKGEWIIGVGWDDHYWQNKELLTADALEKAAPHHPVVLQRSDTHLMWVNHQMLRLARVDRIAEDPYGGIIGRDSAGKPNGILVDRAMLAVRRIWPHPTFEEKVRIAKDIMREFLQNGLTTVHNAATDNSDFEIFKHLAERNELPLRLYAMISVRDESLNSFVEQGPQHFGDFFQMRCLKFWMDGAMGSRGAALFEPYCDDPPNRGLLLWEEKPFLQALQKAKEKGFQVATHAIGDLAAHRVLNLYEKTGIQDLRWRVEHAQQLIPADFPRFRQMGAIASIQPLHEVIDSVFLDQRLGQERVEQGSFAWPQLLNQQTLLVGGSDAPVVDFNPFLGIHAASAKMTREEALRMYTINAAYASFQEDELGTLTVGKRADLIVLPQDLLTCPQETLLTLKPTYTMVQGQLYQMG